MSKQAGVWYVCGMLLSGIGVGYAHGIGYGVFTVGLFMVFVAIFGTWE